MKPQRHNPLPRRRSAYCSAAGQHPVARRSERVSTFRAEISFKAACAPMAGRRWPICSTSPPPDLDQLGTLDRIDREQVVEFASSMEQPAGGFRGGVWDERSDVEYTFYGLGATALLS
jgi:hypothetical protein